jgi:hypothetical protein
LGIVAYSFSCTGRQEAAGIAKSALPRVHIRSETLASTTYQSQSRALICMAFSTPSVNPSPTAAALIGSITVKTPAWLLETASPVIQSQTVHTLAATNKTIGLQLPGRHPAEVESPSGSTRPT